MGIVSYAQNFEDVMIWRSLRHITSGFYIDVGAQDPLVDSVSRAFHDQGWRGIHVEPVSKYAALLRRHRPGDEVIEAVVGEAQGLVPFFEIAETGLSTANASIAGGHADRGLNVVKRLKPSISLDTIFLSADRDVHWLKVDVEGYEASVLRSWRSDFRPWVVVIESTVPGSQIQSHDEWEFILKNKGYIFVWFDGLNRFYLHEDHSYLIANFRSPPNIFDNFIIGAESSSSFSTGIRNNIAGLMQEVQAAMAQAAEARSWAEAHLVEVCREKDDALAAVRENCALVGEQLSGELAAKDRLLLELQVAYNAAALAAETRHGKVVSEWMSALESERLARNSEAEKFEDARARDRLSYQESIARLEADLERSRFELRDVTISYERVLRGVNNRAEVSEERRDFAERELEDYKKSQIEFLNKSKKSTFFGSFFIFGSKSGSGPNFIEASTCLSVNEAAPHRTGGVERGRCFPAASKKTAKMKRDMFGFRKSAAAMKSTTDDSALFEMLQKMANDLDEMKISVSPTKMKFLSEPDSSGLTPRGSDVFACLARAIGPRFSQDD